MIVLKIEDIQQICKGIADAVDSSQLSVLTEALELKVQDQVLYLAVTNREYYVRVRLNVQKGNVFHATVNASLFLKLISQITTETIELDVQDNYLVIKGNGVYKLPLIYDGDQPLSLPAIPVNNATAHFYIKRDILTSILTFNSKELQKGFITHPVQKLYYMDEKGAITFTSGACVNSFTLEQPVKILLDSKLVKLFKLFKEENVLFTLGHEAASNDQIQSRVSFATPTVEINAILNSEEKLINAIPVNVIREKASTLYPYTATFNKHALTQAINRLALFKNSDKVYNKFEFEKDCVTIYDSEGNNKETICYNNTNSGMEEREVYTTYLDFADLRAALDTCSEAHITLNFGDNAAMTIIRGNICNIIPEARMD